MAMGQNLVPVNIPIPTKIDQNGWYTYPNMVPLVLNHGHMCLGDAHKLKIRIHASMTIQKDHVMQRGNWLIAGSIPSLIQSALCTATDQANSHLILQILEYVQHLN